MEETKPRTKWLLGAILVLMLAQFIVPYTLLTNVEAWYGSFLFWMAATAVVIIINFIIAFEWKD